MKKNKNLKTIMLAVALIAIILSGIYIIGKTGDESDINVGEKDGEASGIINNENIAKSEGVYKERLVFEDIYSPVNVIIAEYKSLPVKVFYDENSDKIKLMNLKTKEAVAELINEDVISGSSYFIDKYSTFWTVGFDNENGKIMVQSYDEKGNKKSEIELKDYKGVIAEDSDGSYSYIMTESFKTDDEFIYLLSEANSQSVLQIYSKEGELKYFHENIQSFDIDDAGNLYMTVDNSGEYKMDGFVKINSVTSDEIYRVKTDDYINHIRYNHAKNIIYCLHSSDTTEVRAYDSDSGLFIKSVYNFAYGDMENFEGYIIRDFAIDNEGDFYVSIQDLSKDFRAVNSFLYAYERVEGTIEKGPITLTIDTHCRSDFISDAIIRYEKKYPAEHIEYSYAYNTEKEFLEKYGEYLQRFTMNILSGDMADIVQTGYYVIEYRDFAKTDAFVDLLPYIEKDKSYKEINKNIIDGLKVNGKVTALPLSTYNFYVEVNEELAEKLNVDIDDNVTWREALQLTKIIEEKFPDTYLFNFGESNPSMMCAGLLIEANMPDLIDYENKTVNLDEEWFKELLKELKESTKSKNFAKTDGEFDLTNHLQGCLFSIGSNDRNYADLLAHFTKYNKEGKSKYIPIFSGEKNKNRIGLSNDMLSINNRSERKENAWKFLSFLMEEDINGLISLENFPVNKNSFDAMVKRAEKNRGISEKKNPEEFEDVQRFNKYMKNINDNVDFLYDIDYIKVDIQYPVLEYIQDKISLEDALEKAEKNIMLHLNE